MSKFAEQSPDSPGAAAVDMEASAELQAWLSRLEAEDSKIGLRNKYLAGGLAAGVLLLLVILWVLYKSTIGAYAIIDQIEIQQHPAEQGRLLISFRVLRPGKIHCRRTCGNIETDVIDTFTETGKFERPWSWVYQPGQQIDVKLWYRRGMFRKLHQQSFDTLDRADIVILMDTTESMDRSIGELTGKCAAFSDKLKKKALQHRFALIAFGDTRQGTWLDTFDFTADVNQFVGAVRKVERFRGGDVPESALDALEEALSLPMDEHAIRRFYLVTDADFHEPTRSGATADDIMARMKEHNVLLSVFSQSKFKPHYAKLLDKETGRFRGIANFGDVLSEGRVLGE